MLAVISSWHKPQVQDLTSKESVVPEQIHSKEFFENLVCEETL